MLDATSALRCRIKDKELTSVQPGVQLAAGADYESDDEQDGKKIRKKPRTKLDMAEEFGADENEPNR